MQLYVVTGRVEGVIREGDLKSKHADALLSRLEGRGVLGSAYIEPNTGELYAFVGLADQAEADQLFGASAEAGEIAYSIAPIESLKPFLPTVMADAPAYKCGKGHGYDAFDLPDDGICKLDGTSITRQT